VLHDGNARLKHPIDLVHNDRAGVLDRRLSRSVFEYRHHVAKPLGLQINHQIVVLKRAAVASGDCHGRGNGPRKSHDTGDYPCLNPLVRRCCVCGG
jgi:hypothetical protein